MGEVEESITTLSTMTLDLVCPLNSNLTHITTLATPGGSEGQIDFEGPRFCFVSDLNLKLKLQEDYGLSRIVATEGSFSISKTSRADDSQKLI